MTTAIDIGNTKTKVALFENSHLKDHFLFSSDDVMSIIDVINNQDNITGSIIASTKHLTAGFKKTYLAFRNSYILSDKTPLPIQIDYKTTETLGTDRVAASCGAFNLHPKSDLLIITAGTCITYNLLLANGKFKGGAIAPGLYMRYNALHTFTDKLPLVENTDFDELVGQSTNESILSGVRQGILAEVDGIISAYRNVYPNLKVLITGGDIAFFESRLKNEIFAHPFLILQGLNSILKYNSED